MAGCFEMGAGALIVGNRCEGEAGGEPAVTAAIAEARHEQAPPDELRHVGGGKACDR